MHADTAWDSTFIAFSSFLADSDLVIANLEGPITTQPQNQPGYDLRSSTEALSSLKAAGITHLTIANNHIADAGTEGVKDTQRALIQNNLISIGPNPIPYFQKIHGQRIAILALNDITQPIEPQSIIEHIQQIKSQSDWLIISIHWGIEYQASPTQRQQDLASKFASAGADIILGHHPHVLQPVTRIEQTGTNHQTIVAYSLGNALFDQPFLPDTTQSACLLLTIDKIDGIAISVFPFTINTTRGIIQTATPQEANYILERLHLTSSIEISP